MNGNCVRKIYLNKFMYHDYYYCINDKSLKCNAYSHTAQ